MSRKSQRGRGRHIPQDKKRKDRQNPSTRVVRQQVVAQTSKPVSQPSASAPSGTTSAQTATTSTHYPYIAAELRRIGILTGIILVILAVLAWVLS